MPWVRLDEEFARHPKVLAAGPLGMAMQVAALCYCNSYLTDGFVPRSVVPGLLHLEGLGMRMWNGDLIGSGEDADFKIVVEDLIDAGLWEEVPGGFRIHDFHQYQPTKDEVLAEREQKRAAGQKGGRATAQARAAARGGAGAAKPSDTPKRGGGGRPRRQRADQQVQAPAQAPAQAESKPVPVPVLGSVSSSVTEVDARDALLPLREALDAVRLHVRWDRLAPDAVDRVAWLIGVHGVPALVAAAQRAWQPNDPPAYANAWLGAWDSLPLPRPRLVAALCDVHQLDQPCRGCAADAKAGTA